MVELSDCGGEIDQTAVADSAGTTLAAACFGGRRSCCSNVSRTMPRKVRVVVGRSSFSEATGMPNRTHTSSTLDIASGQVSLPGKPTSRKSSR